MQRDDRESRSAAAGGSGGGTDEQWTEEDFKQRVRERLDRIEGHLERIDRRLDSIGGHGEGPPHRATLSRLLGIRWQRAKRWITSPDPLYERKKGGATD